MKSIVGGLLLVVAVAGCAKKAWVRYDPEFVSNDKLAEKIQELCVAYGKAGRVAADCTERNRHSQPEWLAVGASRMGVGDPCITERLRENELAKPLLDACQAYCDRVGEKDLPVGCPPIPRTPFGHCYR